MDRRGATTKGIRRRVENLGFASVPDPRVAAKVDIALPTLLTALTVATVTQARSLRAVERRTEPIASKSTARTPVPLHWLDVCRVLELDSRTATVPEVRVRLAERFGETQLCLPENGDPYARMRMHTA